MITLPLAEARNQLSKIVDDVERTHDTVTITRNGKPSVVLLSVDDYESIIETFALLENQEEQDSLAHAKAEYEREDVTTEEEMEQRIRERLRREGGG